MQSAGYQVPIPEGVDPNFPIAEAAMQVPEELVAREQAIQSQGEALPGVTPNTSPALPGVPQQPGPGSGIETQRFE